MQQKRKKYTSYITGLFFMLFSTGCEKLVDIPLPISSITTSQAFSTGDQAIAAMSGVYYNMISTGSQTFYNGGMTIYAGLSSDELSLYYSSMASAYQFYTNGIVNNNEINQQILWSSPFIVIYQVNAIIEGLKNTESVSDSLKTKLTAEAKFVRAFSNFYLVNLFSDIPMVTTTNWRVTSHLSQTPKTEMYQFILNDLKDAQAVLPDNYNVSKGERIVPNKWAATALLARVNLYLQNWAEAEKQATEVINHSMLFELEPNPEQVFSPNSREAIWQLKHDNTNYPYNATNEATYLIPYPGSAPFYPLSEHLLAAFEPEDGRRLNWIDSTEFFGVRYFYPYKYKTGTVTSSPNGAYTEYYMVLRLAELLLIRAEARAQQNPDLEGALADLNAVRNRASLPDIDVTSQEDLLEAIAHERQVEFFAEWGHRWLDLKRTGKATEILQSIKPEWSTEDELYPIPFNEINTDPNLTQNPGY